MRQAGFREEAGFFVPRFWGYIRLKAFGAVSSAVELHVYTVAVGGSIPSPPTKAHKNEQGRE